MENSNLVEAVHKRLSAYAFQNGGWNSYQMENCNLSTNTTPYTIKWNLSNVLNEAYEVTSKFVSFNDLISFHLHLKEKATQKTKKKTSKKKDTNLEKEPDLKTYTFKLAASVDDQMVFSANYLSSVFRNLFANVFESDELIPLDLNGSPPYQLLLLHRQRAAGKGMEYLMEKFYIDKILSLEDLSQKSDALKSVERGVAHFPQPQIKRITSSLSNVPLDSEDKIIQDIQMGTVELELKADSILDLYLDLAKKSVVSRAPDWLIECRREGKTHRNLRLS